MHDLTKTASTKYTSLKPGPRLQWYQVGDKVKSDLLNGKVGHGKTAPGMWNDGYLTTPLDHSNPEGEQLQVRFRMRFANKQPAPRGLFFTHCGGPGTGKDCMVLQMMDEIYKVDLYNNFDIVAVDQRGVGQSFAPGGEGVQNIFSVKGKTCVPVGQSPKAIKAALQAQHEWYKQWYKMKEWQTPKGNYPSTASEQGKLD